MTTAPRVLDPRNEKATTPPAFYVIGESGEQHAIPAFKFWSKEVMSLIDSGTGLNDMDKGMYMLLGEQTWDDIAATGVNALYIVEAVQEVAGDLKGDVPAGESSGSTASSGASGATTSKPVSDENTVSSSGEILTPIG